RRRPRSLRGDQRRARPLRPSRPAHQRRCVRLSPRDREGPRCGARRAAFSNKAIEMALASYPGFFVTAPPADASPYGVYWPALVPSELVEHRVVIGGETVGIPPVVARGGEASVAPVELPPSPSGPVERVPLGRVFGARSGDKGGNANVGVWARSGPADAWLERGRTVGRLRRLVP